MPLTDPKAGSVYVWLVSCFLFLAIIAGGGFLLLYTTQPQTESTSWLPVAGVVLVCLPWFFWFLTFIYRIFSRLCGIRIGGGGGSRRGGGGGGANVANTTGNVASADAENASPGSSNGRRVHFGMAVVVDEQQGHNGDQTNKDESRKGTSSSHSNNDHSYTSHESEMPLALSMGS